MNQRAALDSDLQALLSRPGGLRLPALRDLPPAEARAQHRNAALASIGTDRAPEPVHSVTSATIASSTGPVEVRIYRPGGAALPAIVYLHGGGWVLGDLDVQDPTCRYLANRCAAVVVAVDYRLAPEHPFPAALDDTCEAVLWTRAHARDVGADERRLAVAGSSAGANLAAGAALRLRDAGLSPLAAQLLLYPPTDPLLQHPSVKENGEGYYLTEEDMRSFVDAYLPDPSTRTLPFAGPLHAPSLAGLPPAVVATAGYDPLRDEGMAYAARMRTEDVPVAHLHFPELIHGFFAFARHSPAAARARDQVLTAFSDVL